MLMMYLLRCALSVMSRFKITFRLEPERTPGEKIKKYNMFDCYTIQTYVYNSNTIRYFPKVKDK